MGRQIGQSPAAYLLVQLGQLARDRGRAVAEHSAMSASDSASRDVLS